MRRRRYFSVLLLLLFFSKVWAQQVDSSRFFPLEVRFWTRVSVYDVLGRKVATLLDGHCGSGPCELTWNASGLPRGAYYARIEQGGHVQTITLIVGR